MTLYNRNQLLFFESDKVYVVVSGSILMKNHDRNILLPQTYAKFGEGDILNFKQESSDIFYSCETWFYCQVETEIAIFDRDYFESIWKDLMIQDKLVLMKIMECHSLFKKLNELSLMTLIYELIEVRTFKKGEIIMQMSK